MQCIPLFSFPKTKNHKSEAVFNTFISGWGEQHCAVNGQIWLSPEITAVAIQRFDFITVATMKFRASSRYEHPQGQGTFIFWGSGQKKNRTQFICQVKSPLKNKRSSWVCNVEWIYRSHRGRKIMIFYDIVVQSVFGETCVVSQGCPMTEITWNLGILNKLSRSSPYSVEHSRCPHGNLISSASDTSFKRRWPSLYLYWLQKK